MPFHNNGGESKQKHPKISGFAHPSIKVTNWNDGPGMHRQFSSGFQASEGGKGRIEENFDDDEES